MRGAARSALAEEFVSVACSHFSAQ